MKASQLYGTDPTKVTYGFDIYHGDDENGFVQFNLAANMANPVQNYPLRKFMWTKATQGATYRDPHFVDHITQGNLLAKALRDHPIMQFDPTNPSGTNNYTPYPNTGFLPGWYGWVDPSSPAQAQADNMLLTTQKYVIPGLSLVHMLDIEPTVNTTTGERHLPSPELAYKVAHLLKMSTGFWPILYFSDSDYQTMYKDAFPIGMFTLCLARYASTDPVPNPDPEVIRPATYTTMHSLAPSALGQGHFHQYTGTGRLSGNNPKQNFDLDVYFGSFADLKAKHTIR